MSTFSIERRQGFLRLPLLTTKIINKQITYKKIGHLACQQRIQEQIQPLLHLVFNAYFSEVLSWSFLLAWTPRIDCMSFTSCWNVPDGVAAAAPSPDGFDLKQSYDLLVSFPSESFFSQLRICGSSARRILQWQSDIEALSKLGSILTASSRSVPPGLKRDFRCYQRFQSHLITRGFYSSWSSYGFNIQDLFTSMRLNIVWCIIGLWFP